LACAFSISQPVKVFGRRRRHRRYALSRITDFAARLPDPNPDAVYWLELARSKPYRLMEIKRDGVADLVMALDGIEHRLATGAPNRIEGLRLEANAMLTVLGPT
jgi:hypothetical protein